MDGFRIWISSTITAFHLPNVCFGALDLQLGPFLLQNHSLGLTTPPPNGKNAYMGFGWKGSCLAQTSLSLAYTGEHCCIRTSSDTCWDISPTRCAGGILMRCPDHLKWFLLMWRSSSFTLRNPATLWRKPFPPLVSTISSVPSLLKTNDHRWG